MGFQLVFLSGRGWPRVYFVYSPYRSHGMSRRVGAGVESESTRGVIMLGLCENSTDVARVGRLGGLGGAPAAGGASGRPRPPDNRLQAG